MSLFTGSGVAIITPFENDQVNYARLGELLEWHIAENTDAIIICGTTGETSTMTVEEHKETIKFAVDKVNQRIPVIAGTGSNNTKHAIEMSTYAEKVGVDGLLIVTPYYNKTTQKGLIAHYTAIADCVNTPIILYNVPSRTGMNIEPQTVLELSKHQNIIGIKEASGNISYATEIVRLCPADFNIYSGNDDMIIPILSLGGKGVISVVANILPNETHNLVTRYLTGDIVKARDLQLKMNGVINALFVETNPIPVKTAMNLMGMSVGNLRLPLTDMTENNLKILIDQMSKYGFEVRR